MKLEIVNSDAPRRFKVRPGWSNYSGYGEEYIDFERDIFTIAHCHNNGSKIYIQEIITFHAPKNDGDYTEAYVVIKQNNPDGDHDESDATQLNIEVALAKCLEELK